MFLFGNYQHSLDDKNRLRLPSKFREELGNSYILTPGCGGCIFVYPNDENCPLLKRLDELDPLDPDAAESIRRLTELAAVVVADAQGRFMIPADLMTVEEIRKDVRIVGARNHAEIWSEERYVDRCNNLDRSVSGLDATFKDLHERT